MPESYNKIAEGIVKGTVPMVASFVERYVSDDEPGFFAGEREHIEGDIRVHVTIFGHLEQADSMHLGVVDLQQLPEGRVWMVVGVLPTVTDGEAWLNDVYSAMVRRMAARLVQFGFIDAPNRPRLKPGSPLTLTQVAQALKPARPAPTPSPAPPPAPAPAAEQPKPAPAAAPAEPVRPEKPAAAPSVSQAAPPAPAPQPAFVQPAPSPAVLSASQVTSPPPSLLGQFPTQQLDLVLTIVMVFIWALACGVLFYLLTLLLK